MTAPAELRGDGGGREERQANDTEFRLTDNPRELRALHAALRRRGLEFPCDRIPDHDRDGKSIRRGVYHLTDADCRKLIRALTRRDKQ